MLLAIDAGNSTIAFGIYPNPLQRDPLLVTRLPTDPPPSAGECVRALSGLLCRAGTGHRPGRTSKDARTPEVPVIISSVVPRLTRTIIAAARAVSRRSPLVVSHRVAGGLELEVRNPSKVGSDRIANAVAASALFRGPVAVADCGTATTLTVVGRGGRLLGGAIMPGLSLMTAALHRSAARLPRAPLGIPREVLGRETSESIASGVIYGTAGALQFLLHGIEKELGFRVQLVLTGGHGALVSPLIRRRHRLIPSLTFEGLRLIYLRNAPPVT